MLRFIRYFIFICASLSIWTASGQKANSVQLTVRFRQSEEKDYIPYQADKKLGVKDFQAAPDYTTKGVAATYSGIQMGLRERTEKGSIHIEVDLYVYFDKNRSWMKQEGQRQDVLDHEQLHFDITALFACNLKQLMEAAALDGKDALTLLKKLHQQQMQLLQESQNKYDRESKHGTDTLQQKAWTDKIRGSLNKRSCY